MHTTLQKSLAALAALITNPKASISWIARGTRLTDQTAIDMSYWVNGALPRRGVSEVFPETKEALVTIPRAFNRTYRTSITIGEAVHLAALVTARSPERILEIGTFDGNTTLLLAMNAGDRARVTTVDLPPTFDPGSDKGSLAFQNEKINLTPRDKVATQYQGSPYAKNITQVYGDSGSLDWNTFGGPFDLIFIDGCHTSAYVERDTRNAFSVIAPGGIILWHDYGDITDVSDTLDRLVPHYPEWTFVVLEGTRLALAYPASHKN